MRDTGTVASAGSRARNMMISSVAGLGNGVGRGGINAHIARRQDNRNVPSQVVVSDAGPSIVV